MPAFLPGAAPVSGCARFYALVRAGQMAEVLPTVEQVTGCKPRTLDDRARENAAAFA